jgi:hypothetical protein
MGCGNILLFIYRIPSEGIKYIAAITPVAYLSFFLFLIIVLIR